MKENNKDYSEILKNLPQFICTNEYHLNFTGLVYTDGVAYLADAAECHWLIDLIGSYQKSHKITKDPMLREMQFWELVIGEGGGSGRVTCYRDDNDEAFHQDIEFTDFPEELSPMKIWVSNGVAMLPSEH